MMKKPKRLFYGWVIVAVGIVVFTFAYGVRYSFSVIFSSLLEQFHWSQGATSLMLSIHILTYGLTAPIAGASVDRLGAKKTMCLGAILLSLGAAAASRASTLWQFYLSFGVLVGVGLGLIGAVPLIRIISNWFTAKRGLALSLMYFGSGGSFLIYPLVAFLIEKVGWSGTFQIEAVIVAVVLLPSIAFFIRFHPKEKGLNPDDRRETAYNPRANQELAGGAVYESPAVANWTLRKAVTTKRFWLLCLSAFAIWGIADTMLVS